jgi:hypothetical protein
MNKRFLHIAGLFSCFCFLVGNILFDVLDTPLHPADYRLYYIPLSVMIFVLVALAKDYAKKESHVVFIFWWFFFWLSVGQMVKFAIFNPYIQMVSDYLFLALTGTGTIIKLCQLKAKK